MLEKKERRAQAERTTRLSMTGRRTLFPGSGEGREDRKPSGPVEQLFRAGQVPAYPKLYNVGDENRLQDDMNEFVGTLNSVFKNAPQTARTIEFRKTVQSLTEVGVRLRAFHGRQGPNVLVENVEVGLGNLWKTPGSDAWYAITAGDQNREVLRFSMPLAQGRCRKVSLQLTKDLGSNQYTMKAHGVRECFEGHKQVYVMKWVVAFGRAREPAPQAMGGLSLAGFL